jgi:hypothetical protein
MVNKSVRFPRVQFTAEVLTDAYRVFQETLDAYDDPHAPESGPGSMLPAWAERMEVSVENTTYSFDTLDEFFSELRRPFHSAYAAFRGVEAGTVITVSINMMPGVSTVHVIHPERAGVERLMAPFERAAPGLREPEPEVVPLPIPRPRIFVGHGGSSTGWSELKDHLAHQHGYEVEAFQTGARSGHTIRDILDDMLDVSTFAILVMSAEDPQADPTLVRARQNVVHEAGLFQGRLGFSKTLILLEEGTEPFSNVAGIQYISYARGNIRETYGDVLATLRREFPTS